MKNLEQLELTLAELGGREPEAGEDVTIRGECYRIMDVTPPVTKPPSKWRRKPESTALPKWRLLVQRVS